MAKIAILGFGTVGSGVYEVLCRNAAGVSRRAGEPVEVKYILDPKDFSGHPAANLFVKSIDTILQDPEVRVVVETIGGTRFAYPYVKACLESGRSVCTSNKEMVATYGAELLGLAKAHDCAFLFEASVGGGTVRYAQRADAHAGGYRFRSVHYRVPCQDTARGHEGESTVCLRGAGSAGLLRSVHLLGNQLGSHGRPDDVPDLSKGKLVSGGRFFLAVRRTDDVLYSLDVRRGRLAVHMGVSGAGDGVSVCPAGV